MKIKTNTAVRMIKLEKKSKCFMNMPFFLLSFAVMKKIDFSTALYNKTSLQSKTNM
jgi:hypothetical protein